jgi:hypothetical protein
VARDGGMRRTRSVKDVSVFAVDVLGLTAAKEVLAFAVTLQQAVLGQATPLKSIPLAAGNLAAGDLTFCWNRDPIEPRQQSPLASTEITPRHLRGGTSFLQLC